MSVELLNLLGDLNPTSGQVSALFTGLSKIPAPILQVILKGLNEDVVRKIATWAQTFTQHLNDLGPGPIDPAVLKQSMESGTSDDFMTVMGGTKYIGPTLSADDLNAASNAITKAIKAEDWQQAVQLGLMLAKGLPV